MKEYPVERVLGMLRDLKADIFTFTQAEKKYQNTKKRYFELYSINLWPSWNTNIIYFRAKAVNSRTVEPGNWLGWKNNVRFAIKMGKMTTRLSKRNEGVYPKMVRISSNEQCWNKTYSVLRCFCCCLWLCGLLAI